jgi:uncharacterized protein (TIGR03437 family)
MKLQVIWFWLAVASAAGAAAGPAITGASPNPINAAGPFFPLTITGTGFVNGSEARWGTTVLSTEFINSQQLQAEISPDLRLISDNYPLTVTNPGGVVSNQFPMTVSPVLTYTIPYAAVAGSGPLNITLKGAGYQARFVTQLSTPTGPLTIVPTSVNATTLTAVIPASALADARTAPMQVVDPLTGNISASVDLQIRGTPAISGAAPSPIDAGGPYFLLTVTGSGFLPGMVVNWPGVGALGTNCLSTTQIQAAITPELRTLAGSFQVTVSDPATGAVSNSYAVVVSPVLFSISPATAVAGSPALPITVTGAGFTANTLLAITVAGKQSTLPTTYVNTTTLTATIPASALGLAGSLSIQVIDSTGGGHSLSQSFAISRAAATITSLMPSAVTAGAPAFTLTVNGSNFATGATVLWNGSPLTTSFVSPTQVTAAVPASLVSGAGAVSISVTLAGGATAPIGFTINPPPPVLGSISPVSTIAGSPAITLTASVTNCSAGCIVQWNGVPLSTSIVSATQATATVPAYLLAAAGTATIRLVNANGTGSNPAAFVINPAAPTLTSVSPASITAGGTPVTLAVTGFNFATGATVLWNGTPLPTTFIGTSQVSTTVPASLLNGLLSATITVSNPGGAVSGALTVSITAPAPSIATLSPASAVAGSGPFTLTVSGQNFAINCVVRWNGAPLYTALVSATQASATVPADLIAVPGAAAITLANPSGLESKAATFTVGTPVPALSSLSPTSSPAGAGGFTLTVAGTGFVPASIVLWNGSPLTTTFVTSSQLTADVPAWLLATPGLANVTVSTPGVSSPNAATFTIGVPLPSTTTAAIVNAASSLPAIAPGSLLSIYGSNLAFSNAAAQAMPLPLTLNGTSVSIDGIAAPLLFVSTSQINVQVPFEVQPGAATLTVQTGTLKSIPITFQVQPVAPGVLAAIQTWPDGSLNSQQAPARAGQYVTLYVTGQGSVDPPVATGTGSPSGPFAAPLAAVTAQVGGQDAQIAFAGMAPGLAGWLQVNLVLPPAGAGQQNLTVTIGGVKSNVVPIWME